MSIKETTRVWDESKQDSTALLILLAIADQANDQGHAWPGRELLAKRARCDPATVTRLIAQLEADGELHIARRRGRGSHYMVLAGLSNTEKQARRAWLDALFPPEASGCNRSLPPNGESESGFVPNPDLTGGCRVVPKSIPDPLIDPEEGDSDIPEEILLFWQTALGELQMQMPREAFDNWLSGAEVISYEDGLFVILVRDAYAREWLEHRLKKVVLRTLASVAQCNVDVKFVAEGSV